MDPFSVLVLSLAMWSSHGAVKQFNDFEKTSHNSTQYYGKPLTRNVIEGEGLCLLAKDVPANTSVSDITWYKDYPWQVLNSSEEQHIHHHGDFLLFLPISINDSGIYYTHWTNQLGNCSTYATKLFVLPAQPLDLDALVYETSESDENIELHCPITDMCNKVKGEFSWFRNSSLIAKEHNNALWVVGANKSHEADYKCLCTWSHNGHLYNTSGFRRLVVQEPKILFPPQIISPANLTVITAIEGSEVNLTCSAFFGLNIKENCWVSWEVDGTNAKEMEEYTLHSREEEKNHMSVFTTVLTIQRVSAHHYRSEFRCTATSNQYWLSSFINLKPEASLRSHIVAWLCVLLLFLLATVAVKLFAVDLALFFRRVFTCYGCPVDGKVFDAYVIYQSQGLEVATEKKVCYFVSSVLPTVLEEKCGFRLFIHGRDDLPGEDRMELTETRVRLSRRLMVVLTPWSGSGSEVEGCTSQLSPVGEFDWQVGLHQALVQREMSVILIQLGDTGPQGYRSLPPGLQHLVRKSAPLRWQEGARGATMPSSAFWKRVRYMMPVASLKNSPLL